MLRVTVELVPFGFEYSARNLCVIEISNIGEEGITFTKKGEKRYSYNVKTITEGNYLVNHGVLVKRHDREQPLSKLLNKILKKLENKGVFKRV